MTDLLHRLILYYPVSALVTLFANILQNPQDARARGDLKLMSSVCSFLTMLERDAAESSGNVRRMLSVCSEFERIAQVVLDKAEREMRGRGKRKATERASKNAGRDVNGDEGVRVGLEEGKTLEMLQVETQAGYRRPVQTASLRRSMEGSTAGGSLHDSPASFHSPAGGAGPDYRTPPDSGHAKQQQQQTTAAPTSQAQQQQQRHSSSTGSWNGGYPNANGMFTNQQQDFTNQSPPQLPPYNPNLPNEANTFNPATLMDPLTGGVAPPAFNPGGFQQQQPFVPQDLWQMPMTLEWDWAEGLGIGSFTPGGMFDGGGFMGDLGGQDGQDGMGGGQE